jgi:cell division transport system permease protein
MKISLVGLVFRQVGTSFRHLFWTHVLTAATMAITLFSFGAFMLLQTNLEYLLKGWGDQLQITAYLNNGLAEAEVGALMQRIEAMPEVARARHISHAEAWRDFQTALGTQSGLLDGLPRDVLPASIEITIKPENRDGKIIGQLAARLLKDDKDIASVEYPQEWVERLELAVLAVGWGKWILGGVLFLATLFVVRSTVKLALFARKEEVEIMQLVGASEELIQAPFVLEGMIQGLTGAGVSLAALWGVYCLLQDQMPTIGAFLGPFGQLQFLAPHHVALLVATGWILGSAGSLFSLRRFVRTWHPSIAKF